MSVKYTDGDADMHAPITLFYAAALGILMAVLSIRIPILRGMHNLPWGDGGIVALATSIRVFGNFIEYVPMFLLLLFLLEISDASPMVLHGLGIVLSVARVVHAVSLKAGNELSTMRKMGRAIGAMLTWLVILVAAGYGGYIALEHF